MSRKPNDAALEIIILLSRDSVVDWIQNAAVRIAKLEADNADLRKAMEDAYTSGAGTVEIRRDGTVRHIPREELKSE